ncbi:MAG: HD domain-containing protein [Lachnospiraceae bacterium]|nr:HD domain-containing protein [Lachnospiraceae bacterium]
MRWIETMREGDRISDIYLCKNKVNAKTKIGKSYYSLLLQDKTGTVDGKVWDLSSGIDHFEAMQYIHIDGDVTTFQGSLQLNIRRIRLAREGEYNPVDYLPTSPYDRREMYQKIVKLVDSIQDESLHALAASFFVEDKTFIQEFVAHSAAKSVHHSFLGGLLQHTLRVTELCDFYCQQYPALNRDLLIAGALCHDIGKLRELASFPQNDYTDDGQLLGHIVIGYQMVMERIATIPGFPPRKASELGHLILSHHGELEYGSPKKPALIEAVALHHADNTDAKLETMSELLSGALNDTDWLGYQRLLETNIRKTSQ